MTRTSALPRVTEVPRGGIGGVQRYERHSGEAGARRFQGAGTTAEEVR
ncbi:hypothetical protein HNR02_001282 [Amycolatopsis endophytica]|uniref:Uncharacterized protein n=1 Tax=Amycolatopsis endophytica TaxID=860233 RepID=A0A853AZ91_9PSEU|nr:hypothetical protein [Amycolatopsis endophytica]